MMLDASCFGMWRWWVHVEATKGWELKVVDTLQIIVTSISISIEKHKIELTSRSFILIDNTLDTNNQTNTTYSLQSNSMSSNKNQDKAPEVDVNSGKIINPHNPEFVSPIDLFSEDIYHVILSFIGSHIYIYDFNCTQSYFFHYISIYRLLKNHGISVRIQVQHWITRHLPPLIRKEHCLYRKPIIFWKYKDQRSNNL